MKKSPLSLITHIVLNVFSLIVLITLLAELAFWNYHSLNRWGEFVFDEIYLIAIIFAMLPAALSWHYSLKQREPSQSIKRIFAHRSLTLYFIFCVLTTISIALLSVSVIFYSLSIKPSDDFSIAPWLASFCIFSAGSYLLFKLVISQRIQLKENKRIAPQD